MATTKPCMFRCHEELSIKTICIYKTGEKHTHKMMVVILFHFYQIWKSKRSPVVNCNIFRNLTFCFFNKITVVVQSTMVTSDRLSNKWCNLRILLSRYAGSNVCMVWSMHCLPKDILLPLHLLFSFIMQKSHDSPKIPHAEFRSKGTCQSCNLFLMFFIRLNI